MHGIGGLIHSSPDRVGLSGLEVMVWHLADPARLREGQGFFFVASGLVKGLVWPSLNLCKEKDLSEVNGPYKAVRVSGFGL